MLLSHNKGMNAILSVKDDGAAAVLIPEEKRAAETYRVTFILYRYWIPIT